VYYGIKRRGQINLSLADLGIDACAAPFPARRGTSSKCGPYKLDAQASESVTSKTTRLHVELVFSPIAAKATICNLKVTVQDPDGITDAAVGLAGPAAKL
jgi:hypothetical protein